MTLPADKENYTVVEEKNIGNKYNAVFQDNNYKVIQMDLTSKYDRKTTILIKTVKSITEITTTFQWFHTCTDFPKVHKEGILLD